MFMKSLALAKTEYLIPQRFVYGNYSHPVSTLKNLLTAYSLNKIKDLV